MVSTWIADVFKNTMFHWRTLGTKVFNMLPSYIKIESDNPKKFKLVLQEFLYKIPFIPWMNIFNLAKSKINRKF